MAFSYDEALGSALDRTRFALGDTSEAAPLLQDETILAAIAANGEAGAISYLAQGLATNLAYQPDRVSLPGGLSVAFSRVQALQSTATQAGGRGKGTSLDAIRGDDEPPAEYIRPDWDTKWSASND